MEDIIDCEVYEDDYDDSSVPLPPEDIVVPADSIILNLDKVGFVRQRDRLQKAKLTLKLLQGTICEVGQCHAECCLSLQDAYMCSIWPRTRQFAVCCMLLAHACQTEA